jgi:hypothetical protein
MNLTAGTTTDIDTTAHGRAAERAAWVFYLIAAAGSTIGQIWVGVQAPPWPAHLAWWWRAALVTPFAAVIDLGGVVTSAFADARQRLGETAYGWRILSAGSVTTGVAINVLGHADVPYLAVVFGGLGVFAYSVWLMHAAARRRDALRAAGKLADTAPVYGWAQWRREPAVTRRARSLALARGYSWHESLDVARRQLREEKRRAALTRLVETLIRSRHDDPIRAAIAATTLDLDAVAAHLTAHADVAGWASVIGADLLPPPPPTAADDGGTSESAPARPPMPPMDVLRRIPADQARYDRWRQLWAELATDPDTDLKQFAARHDISLRQAQWIRAIGPTGLLDSPGHRVGHVVVGPLGADERRHAHFIASLTHRTTERLSTSRSMASSAFSRRSRANSARSSSLSPAGPVSPRSCRSCLTQLPRVPSWIPRSRATCAIGLPVSRTMRTAPSRNARSNRRLVSAMTLYPLRSGLHAIGGSSNRPPRGPGDPGRPVPSSRCPAGPGVGSTIIQWYLRGCPPSPDVRRPGVRAPSNAREANDVHAPIAEQTETPARRSRSRRCGGHDHIRAGLGRYRRTGTGRVGRLRPH